MLEKNPYPEHVKEKAREEIQRYELLPPGSGEASVERTYLDWLLKVPWWQQTEDNSDLKAVRGILFYPLLPEYNVLYEQQQVYLPI